ncbi:MAG: ABC transporter substrate-binding protein [Spirochaetaceae bacterium]|jgi:NitT/TauT family transport system substrate-binding protein|nr:ABC transporter substrate-binding protein [Spirochaetaceae bacterium]
MKQLLCCILFFCAGITAQAQAQFTFCAVKGPSGVALVQLFENPPIVAGYKIKVDSVADAGQMTARLISGEIKAGILPPNIAAKIAAASGGKNANSRLQIAAVTGNGMLSLLSSDPKVKTLKDLKGKTVTAAGQGAVPEYVFRKILIANNLMPGRDVQLEFTLAYPEIAQSLIAGRIKTALLPEPFASMARAGSKDVHTVDNIQSEWQKVSGQEDYPLTVLVVNAEFARQNPAAVKALLERVKASIEWTNTNPAAAGALAEKHGLGVKASVASSSIPYSNFVYMSGIAAKPALEALFAVLLDFEPASIGGKLPAPDFYYQ